MDVARLQWLCGLCLAGYGLAGTVAPRQFLGLKTRLVLFGFAGEPPTPRPWLVRVTRTSSVGLLVAGLTVAGVAGRLPGDEEGTGRDDD